MTQSNDPLHAPFFRNETTGIVTATANKTPTGNTHTHHLLVCLEFRRFASICSQILTILCLHSNKPSEQSNISVQTVADGSKTLLRSETCWASLQRMREKTFLMRKTSVTLLKPIFSSKSFKFACGYDEKWDKK